MTTKTKPTKKRNKTKTNFWVDLAIFAVFLLTTAPQFTGETIHEWLALAFGGTIIVHLLLHWDWLVAITRRFFKKMPWKTRLNYMLNGALFICMTFMILSGVMISESVVPFLGLNLQSSGNWQSLHTTAADLVVIIVGLHVALHLDWIFNTVKRYLIQPLRKSRKIASKPAPSLSQTAAPQEVVR